MKKQLRPYQAILFLFLAGCAGMSRSCSSCNAGAYGADWLVVQYRNDGTPISCWRLETTSISNEDHSDGIYWVDGKSGNLVHISGWYNRVQVERRQWDHAAKNLGIELAQCNEGVYTPSPKP